MKRIRPAIGLTIGVMMSVTATATAQVPSGYLSADQITGTG